MVNPNLDKTVKKIIVTTTKMKVHHSMLNISNKIGNVADESKGPNLEDLAESLQLASGGGAPTAIKTPFISVYFKLKCKKIQS